MIFVLLIPDAFARERTSRILNRSARLTIRTKATRGRRRWMAGGVAYPPGNGTYERPRSLHSRTRRSHPRVATASPAPPPRTTAALAAVMSSEHFWHTRRPVAVSIRSFVGWPHSSHDPALKLMLPSGFRTSCCQAVAQRAEYLHLAGQWPAASGRCRRRTLTHWRRSLSGPVHWENDLRRTTVSPFLRMVRTRAR